MPASKKLIPSVMLLMMIWLLFSSLMYFWLVPLQKDDDFTPRWLGARDILKGDNPYGVDMDCEYQAERGLDFCRRGHRFFYPATVTWMLLPFWVLPLDVSMGLWRGLQMTLLTVTPLLLYFYLNWRPRQLVALGIVAFSLVGYQTAVNVYFIGQFVIFTAACLVGAWWAANERHDALAAWGPLFAPSRALWSPFSCWIWCFTAGTEHW